MINVPGENIEPPSHELRIRYRFFIQSRSPGNRILPAGTLLLYKVYIIASIASLLNQRLHLLILMALLLIRSLMLMKTMLNLLLSELIRGIL